MGKNLMICAHIAICLAVIRLEDLKNTGIKSKNV